jgi:hypothetical protein
MNKLPAPGWMFMAFSVGLLSFLAGIGCELDSADSVVREVGVTVQGYYTHPDGGRIVGRNSGAAITSLDIRQSGDQLEAIDNNNQVFRGTIGNASQNNASYTLEGYTTSGKLGTMSGMFELSGSQATMRGTWIEDDFYSTIYATATVPTNGGGGTAVKISPSSATLTSTNATQGFSASGGTGSYTWSLANNSGTINSTTGSSVTYTRTGSGNNTITVTDSKGQSASAAISQP